MICPQGLLFLAHSTARNQSNLSAGKDVMDFKDTKTQIMESGRGDEKVI